MNAVLLACAAWNEAPSPAAWEKARGAALDLLRRCGELPRGNRQRLKAAHRLMEACGARLEAAFDAAFDATIKPIIIGKAVKHRRETRR